MPDESTNPDLVEITRRASQAASHRDLDTLMTFYASDAVLDFSDSGMGTYEGVDAIRALIEDWVSIYESYETTTEQILCLGENVSFPINNQMARLPGGGESVRLHDAYVFLFENGLIVRHTAYRDIDEAHAAAERLAEERG
jgi:ketosteroid isomerase-like protein